MEPKPEPFERDLFSLSVRAFEDTLTSDDWVRIEHLLAQHPEMCARWQIFMQFHSDLKTFSTISAAEQRVLKVLAVGHERNPQQIDPEARSRLLALDRPRPASRRAAAWGGALAASLFLAAIGSWWSYLSPTPPEPTASPTGTPVLAIGTLQFPDGMANYYLDGVGDLLVEGPVRLHLDEPKKMRLERGSIRVHVREPNGRGFTVNTPQGTVIDLGTEFAISAFEDRAVDVVVFDGAVELARDQPSGSPINERLQEGEGISLSALGVPARLMQVVSGAALTFRNLADSPEGNGSPIASVSDNLLAEDTKRFYEIVSGGLREDAKAYVDRPYEWNGHTEAGLPEFLRAADYIKTFNDFKRRDIEITVQFARPCTLYVLWDERAPHPQWLVESFTNTGVLLGLDEGPVKGISAPDAHSFGVGPGRSVDRDFSIWSKHVPRPSTVVLGSLGTDSGKVSMYGIAVAK